MDCIDELFRGMKAEVVDPLQHASLREGFCLHTMAMHYMTAFRESKLVEHVRKQCAKRSFKYIFFVIRAALIANLFKELCTPRASLIRQSHYLSRS